MAKKRQARRCRARRTDGRPCKGWAVVGAYVCMAHGGASFRARSAAYHREFERRARAAFNRDYDRWQRALVDFHVHRVAVTAVLLEMPVKDVASIDIVLCHDVYGIPALADQAPQMRHDRRFKLPAPPAALARRPVNRSTSNGTAA